jgi:hypothetical protein
MAAPKGNKFWELRSKHGRDKLFATPELLWEAACEYFEWCRENPWIKKDWVGKDADEVERETERPFTLTGLCIYLDCSSSYFRSFKSTLQEKDKDFLTIITRIEEIIYTQKFEGAAVGAFNANIIARDLGLSDKVNNEHSGEVSVKQITGMEIK